MWAWPGSRDHDNCTVQTAAMGQIPRSTERILVINKTRWENKKKRLKRVFYFEINKRKKSFLHLWIRLCCSGVGGPNDFLAGGPEI